MKRLLKSWVGYLDQLYLRQIPEKPHVLGLMLHKLFEDKNTAQGEFTMPHERLTVRELEALIVFFLEKGYTFITPSALSEGRFSSEKNYVILTFDDGYFNNTLALPVLEKYQVSALFFIATHYTLREMPYWWDVLYRERRKRNASLEQILEEVEEYKRQPREQIEETLRKAFGSESFCWQDLDRPLTTDELRNFAAHPLVHIGNHTADHYALANWEATTVYDQLTRAQEMLAEHAGKPPQWVAYPNGSYTAGTLEIARDVGLEYGLTIEAKKVYFPIRNTMELGRFSGRIAQATDEVFWESQRHDRKPPLLTGLQQLRQNLS